ncbi:MAG: tetratricopeptide repeat protein [Gammaproteobacteria bacterium]|nr:tetratricopeptide repeat protein [Gammaproteobacteria bacterium]
MGAHKQIEWTEKALEFFLEKSGEGSAEVAILRNNLAVAWDSLGEYVKAIELYELALDTLEKNLSMDHPSTRTVVGNLARARVEFKKL